MATTSIFALRDFFNMFGKHYNIPDSVFNSPWFDDFFNHLDDCFSRDDLFSEDFYKGYFDMGLPKSKDYISHFDSFEIFLRDMGIEDSDWDGDLLHSSRLHFISAPWYSWGYERLKSTNDYFWFLVLFIQRMGSLTEYESMDFTNTLMAVHNRGLSQYFDMEWFSPLNSWIGSRKIMDEFALSKGSIKSFKIPDYIMKGFESDDISSVPEYDVEDLYLNVNGNFYHIDKVMLAITASGGFAQALERQDLEPKVTNVASLIGKRRRRKK
jgi:hypothetical protein